VKKARSAASIERLEQRRRLVGILGIPSITISTANEHARRKVAVRHGDDDLRNLQHHVLAAISGHHDRSGLGILDADMFSSESVVPLGLVRLGLAGATAEDGERQPLEVGRQPAPAYVNTLPPRRAVTFGGSAFRAGLPPVLTFLTAGFSLSADSVVPRPFDCSDACDW